MNQIITVQGAPGYYRCETGVLSGLEDYLLRLDCRRVVILHGKKSWDAVNSFFPGFKTLEYSEEIFSGECTDNEIDRIASLLVSADAVAGFGGGKILDTAKAAADKRGIPVITVPTLSATCSAWTPLSVIYDENGCYLRFDVFPRQNCACFFDPRIVLSAPAEYLRSGIGDTLAKWYEADALSKNIPLHSVPVRIGLEVSKICRDVLLKYGEKALDNFKKREMTDELLLVLETIIAAGGSVGGFAERFGRIAAAHSVHNGLTLLPETHERLHGEKVAYGILVQLILEGRADEAIRLVSFFRKIGLPVCMKDLNVIENISDKINRAAAGTVAPGESIHHMHMPVNTEVLADAMMKLESLSG